MNYHDELLTIKEFARQIINVVDKIKLNSTPIELLHLSPRAKNCLYKMGVVYIEDLVKLDKKTIMNLKNMGTHTFKEINDKVQSRGFVGWN